MIFLRLWHHQLFLGGFGSIIRYHKTSTNLTQFGRTFMLYRPVLQIIFCTFKSKTQQGHHINLKRSVQPMCEITTHRMKKSLHLSKLHSASDPQEWSSSSIPINWLVFQGKIILIFKFHLSKALGMPQDPSRPLSIIIGLSSSIVLTYLIIFIG